MTEIRKLIARGLGLGEGEGLQGRERETSGVMGVFCDHNHGGSGYMT